MKFDIGDRVYSNIGLVTIVGYIYYNSAMYYCVYFTNPEKIHDVHFSHVYHKVEEAA